MDIIVIIVYFFVIIAIGYRASKRIKNQEDYLLGGRKFGKLVQVFASFGQATSADGPVGVATTTFRNGAAGIWSSLLMVFSTPVYWITSPWLRRLRTLTMGDFYEERYGSKQMAATYAIIASIGMMGLLSVGYTAMNKTLIATTPKVYEDYTPAEKTEYEQAMELFALEDRSFNDLSDKEKYRLEELRARNPASIFSYINEDILIWVVCLIVLIYAIMGGLEAAFYTDMLQGFFIIMLSLLLIPFSWNKIRLLYGNGTDETGLEILHQKLPEAFFEIFGSPTLMDFTWYFIIAASLIAGITVVTQPNQLVTNAAAKDEYSARFGFVTGTFLKRFCTILWGVLGLSAILLYTGKVHDSDIVWGYATHDLLGQFKIGLVGLMIVSMMAALMSTADCLMLTVSGLLLHNIYRPLFPDKTETNYIWAGRVFGAIFLIGAALIATQFDSILEILKFIWEFFVIFAAAFWVGLKWRRANRQGAWASILITFFLFYLIPVVLPVMAPSIKTKSEFLIRTQTKPVIRTYTVRDMDEQARDLEIIEWDKLPAEEKEIIPRPVEIITGEQFSRTYELPSRTILWSKEPRMVDNKAEARGYVYLELYFLKKIGVHLENLPYALNETIRMMIRLTFPFLILILVSLLTPQQDDESTRRFFLKMRTRVKGLGPGQDLKDLQYSYENPRETEKMLLFPNTYLEFYKWNRQDITGFLIAVGVVFVVLGTLYLAVNIGR